MLINICKRKQGSDGPGKPGKLRELASSSGKSRKTSKTQGILFEANYIDFLQILLGFSDAFSLFDHFVVFVLKLGILIFIIQLPLYLNDL